MSQRGRGSGPRDGDPDEFAEEDAGPERSGGYPLPPAGARPIAPYDPYRSPSSETPRFGGREAAKEPADPLARVRRRSSREVFLPDDDPLSAEAWQLELEDDEILLEADEAPLPDPEAMAAAAAARRPRRQRSATRAGREAGGASGRPPRRTRATPGEPRAGRASVTIGMPQIVAGSPLLADQTALALIGINLASFVVMVLVLAVRLGGLASPMVLRLDAAGNPSFWGPPGVLWRLPLMSLFTTLMCLVVAWFLHPLDRFAARFILGAAIVAQLIAWIAVIQHIA